MSQYQDDSDETQELKRALAATVTFVAAQSKRVDALEREIASLRASQWGGQMQATIAAQKVERNAEISRQWIARAKERLQPKG